MKLRYHDQHCVIPIYRGSPNGFTKQFHMQEENEEIVHAAQYPQIKVIFKIERTSRYDCDECTFPKFSLTSQKPTNVLRKCKK